jgi:SAM-dependent methyltransferase
LFAAARRGIIVFAMTSSSNHMLHIDRREIGHHGPGNLLAVCWRQWRTERALARRGIHFRSTDPETVVAAYEAMTASEFEAINGRQEWANWRTIPRGLSDHVPDRPLNVVDIGCGVGASTRVLAFYCPIGSQIVAYDVVPGFLEHARRRRYVDRAGGPAKVEFVCQRAGEPFNRLDGDVDLVNSCGVLGHHFDRETVRPILAEISRLLRVGGIALLDDGPRLPADEFVVVMAGFGFESLGRLRASIVAAGGQVVFRKREN